MSLGSMGPLTKPVRPRCRSGVGEATKKGSEREAPKLLAGCSPRAAKDRDGGS